MKIHEYQAKEVFAHSCAQWASCHHADEGEIAADIGGTVA